MLKNAFVLFVCTIISKILGFAREMVVAYKFGAGAISDAFVTTNSIPTVLFSSLSVAIGINFIPVLTSIRNDDKKRLRDIFTSKVFMLSLIIMIAGIVFMISYPEVILKIFAGGLDEIAFKYAKNMLYITTFSVIPIVFSQICQSYLQIQNRFVSTGLTGIISNIIIIGFTLLSSSEQYWILSVGTLISNMIVFCVLWFEMMKTGYRFRISEKLIDDNIKKIVLLTGPLMLETLFSEMQIIVDRNMASRLESGTITALSYAGSLTNMLYVMIVTSIITTSFPKFSEYGTQKNYDDLKRRFIYYGDILAMILIPLSILLFILADEIVEVLFMRGAFNMRAATITSECVQFYALGVFAMGMKSYVIRVYYALQDTKTPTRYAVFAMLLNIVLNFLLIFKFQHVGLALATSLANIIAYILLLRQLSKKIEFDWYQEVGKNNIRLLIIATLAGVIAKFIHNILIVNGYKIITVFAIAIIFAFFYILFLYMNHFYILIDVKERIKNALSVRR